jgi:hypothetical protein
VIHLTGYPKTACGVFTHIDSKRISADRKRVTCRRCLLSVLLASPRTEVTREPGDE